MGRKIPKKGKAGRKPNPKKSTPSMRRYWREQYYARKAGKKALCLILLGVLVASMLPIQLINAGYITAFLPFKDGFETDNYSGGWIYTNSGGGSSVEVSAEQKHNGSYSFKASSVNNFATLVLIIPKETTLFARAYVRFSTLPTAAGPELHMVTIEVDDSALGKVIAGIRWNSDNTRAEWWCISRTTGGARVENYANLPSPSINTWYSLELRLVLGNGDGEQTLYIAGVAVIDLDGLDNDDDHPTGYNRFTIGSAGQGVGTPWSSTTFIDDVEYRTSYIGTGYTEDELTLEGEVEYAAIAMHTYGKDDLNTPTNLLTEYNAENGTRRELITAGVVTARYGQLYLAAYHYTQNETYLEWAQDWVTDMMTLAWHDGKGTLASYNINTDSQVAGDVMVGWDIQQLWHVIIELYDLTQDAAMLGYLYDMSDAIWDHYLDHTTYLPYWAYDPIGDSHARDYCHIDFLHRLSYTYIRAFQVTGNTTFSTWLKEGLSSWYDLRHIATDIPPYEFYVAGTVKDGKCESEDLAAILQIMVKAYRATNDAWYLTTAEEMAGTWISRFWKAAQERGVTLNADGSVNTLTCYPEDPHDFAGLNLLYSETGNETYKTYADALRVTWMTYYVYGDGDMRMRLFLDENNDATPDSDPVRKRGTATALFDSLVTSRYELQTESLKIDLDLFLANYLSNFKRSCGYVKGLDDDGTVDSPIAFFLLEDWGVLFSNGVLSSPVPSLSASNETEEAQLCEFSTYWDDRLEEGLGDWIFSWDASGSYVNDTKVEFTGNPDKAWSNLTKTLPAYPKTIHWKIYANDTIGNMAVTDEQTLVVSSRWNVTLTITNLDAGWVFEGKKRYNFQIDYQNQVLSTIKQVGIRFTDSINEVHTILYDRDANTLTVTSPSNGISGWLQSLTSTETGVRAIFQIMFNKPIPDTYAIQLSIKIVTTTDDSGWTAPSGDTFNIYNLGGLSTLTDSGMAGRLTGGDIFEIYAADTRTPILVPPDGFDVKDDPINWWEWGMSEEDLIEEVDWMLWMPRREAGLTMYPTNQLPSVAPQAARAYHSYPFGLRIIDNETDLNRYMYMEKNFWREIDASDNELVYAQFHMMAPEAGSPGDPGAGGEIRVSDRSLKQEGLAYMALQLRFSATGYLTAYNSTLANWVNVTAASSYTWYNVTSIFNLTTQTVDVYVEEVLKLDDLPFVDAECTSLKTLWVGRANAAVSRNDFYVDDIRAWTDWAADYGGMAEATMLFKQLQHWSMDFDFFIEDGRVHAQGASGAEVGRYVYPDDYSDHGYWELGWDVMIDEVWVNDFLVARVNVSDGRISGKDNWVKYNVTWYNQGIRVKSDLLYGLFEGYSIFPGSDKDTSGWHWDIWFNRANASTMVGARLNTEYYGMSDKAVWWAVWSSLWKPMRTEVSESTLFVELKDVNGITHSAKDVLLVRSWVKVLRTSEAEFAYKIVNIGSLNFMVARDTMSGIDTPPIRETVIPDVPSGWFGSAIGGIFTAALSRLGNLLAGFGLGFFSLSIDFIDNILASLGYPALLSTIFGWMDSLFASVPILVGYGMTMIGQIYTLINVSATNTLIQVTSIITIWASMYSTTMDLLTGVLTPGINLWNDLGINSFIQIGAILYPLWLLVLGTDKGGQAVIDHLNGVLNIASFFLNFILNVASFFVNLLTGLIGAIRG